MKTIVITGSSRGIGYGLADSFLAMGCQVIVSGQSEETTAAAVQKLEEKYGPERIFALACDVTSTDALQSLWDKSLARFGKIDIWINNAGLAQSQIQIKDIDPARVEAIIKTNVLGTIYGSQVALQGMLDQGFGSIYTMEGAGSDGRRVMGLAIYGTSKYGLHFFTQSLAHETRHTPVRVGFLRPGMVTTDLLVGQYDRSSEEWQRARKIFNILADRTETVTPWLAKRILNNTKHNAKIFYLTPGKILWRFMTASITKRNVVD
jgi:NAD(P)-dependent dehydrogenase (short-subunit alcohol dehydrogenase family)